VKWRQTVDSEFGTPPDINFVSGNPRVHLTRDAGCTCSLPYILQESLDFFLQVGLNDTCQRQKVVIE
jgi:hypothetical protein